MFEKFLSGNIESFKQRYEGTYGFYKDEEGRRLLVRLKNIDHNRCTFVNAQDISFHMYPDSPSNIGFEFLPPKSQWYNTEYGAVYAQRQASRQWQRGVSSKTVALYSLQEGGMIPMRVDFRNLSAIYENAKSPQEGLDRLEKGGSVAISGQFALCDGIVLLLQERIGSFSRDKSKFAFKLEEPALWKTEITDAMRAIGCSAEIS